MHPTKRYAFSYRPGDNTGRVRRVVTGFRIEDVLKQEKDKILASDPNAGGFLIIDLDQGLG